MSIIISSYTRTQLVKILFRNEISPDPVIEELEYGDNTPEDICKKLNEISEGLGSRISNILGISLNNKKSNYSGDIVDNADLNKLVKSKRPESKKETKSKEEPKNNIDVLSDIILDGNKSADYIVVVEPKTSKTEEVSAKDNDKKEEVKDSKEKGKTKAKGNGKKEKKEEAKKEEVKEQQAVEVNNKNEEPKEAKRPSFISVANGKINPISFIKPFIKGKEETNNVVLEPVVTKKEDEIVKDPEPVVVKKEDESVTKLESEKEDKKISLEETNLKTATEKINNVVANHNCTTTPLVKSESGLYHGVIYDTAGNSVAGYTIDVSGCILNKKLKWWPVEIPDTAAGLAYEDYPCYLVTNTDAWNALIEGKDMSKMIMCNKPSYINLNRYVDISSMPKVDADLRMKINEKLEKAFSNKQFSDPAVRTKNRFGFETINPDGTFTLINNAPYRFSFPVIEEDEPIIRIKFDIEGNASVDKEIIS